MVREIHISTGLYDSKVLSLVDNEKIQFKLVGRVFPNLTYYLKAKNGQYQHNLKFIDGIAEIDRNKLVYGKFKAKVIAMANENVVKEFELEDLLLKELDGEFKVIPELEQVKADFEKLKLENAELKTKVAELEELCENTKELVLELNGITQKVGE